MSKIANIEIDSSIQSLVSLRNVLTIEQKRQWARMVSGYLTESEIAELLSSILRLSKKGGISPDYHALMRVVEEVEGGEMHYYTFASARLKGWNGFELVDEVELSEPARVSLLSRLQSKVNVLLSKYKFRSIRITGFRFDGLRTLYFGGFSVVTSLFMFGLASAYGSNGYPQVYDYVVKKTDSGVSKVIDTLTGVESAKAESIDENISPSPLFSETVASITTSGSDLASSEVAVDSSTSSTSEIASADTLVATAEVAPVYVAPVVTTAYEPAPVVAEELAVATPSVSTPVEVPSEPIVEVASTEAVAPEVIAPEVVSPEVVSPEGKAPTGASEGSTSTNGEITVEVASEVVKTDEIIAKLENSGELSVATGSTELKVPVAVNI